MADSDFSDDEMVELKSAIFEQIAQYETPSIWGRFRQNWAWVAVAASLAIGIGLWWQNTRTVSENTYLAQVNMAKKKYEIIESLNLNEEQKVVSLPDGSSIMLKKGARISYPESFEGDKQEVYLTGEAFLK
jgi:ferric-dicitrate binding protein FerR (iron transport regulator)